MSCIALPPLPCRNELERVYLVNIHYNINVSSSMYAKYYFDLRVLAEENGLSFPNEFLPLTKERAKKLEVCIALHTYFLCLFSNHIQIVISLCNMMCGNAIIGLHYYMVNHVTVLFKFFNIL